MKMKKMEILYNEAKVVNEINDIMIDSTLNAIEKSDDEEKRSKEIELLKTELETKDNFNKVERDFKEYKAWREGYTVATVGAVIGVVVGEYVIPYVVNKLKKN